MPEEKTINKCCGCANKRKELSNEELNKVTGGAGSWQNGKYICSDGSCLLRKVVDGVANVCTCAEYTASKCCRENGSKCTCKLYVKKSGDCIKDSF